ncbi:hypothetical protein [Parasitella parasitica]|uniref:Methyltransferase-domain-containing protein n=1 Tax=Parasitella parasitica TaxID=35722 RepID=A0A0B7MZH3_9FUNG|nr:hypothetical protein [Parasitella parasitica]
MTTSAPLYYIRFLKPPPKECLVGQHFTIVWTIESDLGDLACWQTVPVSVSLEGCSQFGLRELNADPKSSSKKKAAALAKPYHTLEKVALAREIPLVFDPLRGGGIVTKLVIEQMPGRPVPLNTTVDIQLGIKLLTAAARNAPSHSVWHHAYEFQSMWIIPTWSTSISATVAKQRHGDVKESGNQAERMLMANQTRVRIREDAVQSIARHVWLLNNEYNTLLELGSGTGLVGIYAAELLNPKRVYLTDLPDALEIMQQNVDLMRNAKVEMLVKELSWGSENQDQYNDVDLVLLTDVLYNQGSHDVLLDTLDWLLGNNAHCRALLSYKERNPDEREFFSKVAQRNFKCERVEKYEHLIVGRMNVQRRWAFDNRDYFTCNGIARFNLQHCRFCHLVDVAAFRRIVAV